MIIECFAIILLILAISMLYFRTGKKETGISIFPLLTVPVAHIISFMLSKRIAGLINAETATVAIVIHIAALVISAILIGIFADNYDKKYRKLYLAIAGAFCFVLSCILIVNI